MNDPHRPTLEEIEVELRRIFPDLLSHLGIRHEYRGGRFWMLNIHRKDPNWTSFCFNRDNGLWKDYMMGEPYSGKGALSFVAVFCTNGQYKSDRAPDGSIVRPGAVQWAIDFLGWSGRKPDPARAQAAKDLLARADDAAAKKLAEGRTKAKGMWLHAKVLDGTDPASRYLKSRGIDKNSLPGQEWPRALRFSPEVWAQADSQAMRGPHPGMLAAVSDERIEGGFAACHRTYLACHQGDWGKLTWEGCKTGKQVKGSYAGASIRLTRGASGRPLAEARPDEWIQVGEGIEDALTGALAMPDIRALAAVSVTNIPGIHLPAPVGGIYILKQNDDEPEAVKAFDLAMDKLCARGIEPVIVEMPSKFKDANDLLRGKEKVADEQVS